MAYKVYSTNYLMKLTKAEIIDILRTAEHNYIATEEALTRSADYGKGLLKEIEQLKKADVQAVNQWISCKDKMPEDGVTVLIYAGNHMISLAWYDKEMEYFYICDSDYKYNPLDVTHWQPLPKPPTNMRDVPDTDAGEIANLVEFKKRMKR